MHPFAEKIALEIKKLAVHVYAKIYSVVNIEKAAKVSSLPADQTIEAIKETVKDSGMKENLSEDKKSIVVTLVELNVNKRIAEKGNELEERTKKLQEQLSHNFKAGESA